MTVFVSTTLKNLVILLNAHQPGQHVSLVSFSAPQKEYKFSHTWPFFLTFCNYSLQVELLKVPTTEWIMFAVLVCSATQRLSGCLCKGGTKSPLSSLCAIMLIVESNPIIISNECKSIVLSSGRWWVEGAGVCVVFFFFSYKRFTRTFTHDSPVKWRCEKCSLIW